MESLPLENDMYENEARAKAGKLPIVWHGTNRQWYESESRDGFYSGTGPNNNSITFFAYNPAQAKAFAETTARAFNSEPLLVKLDLERARQLGVKIRQKEAEVVIEGEIPADALEAAN